MASAEDSGSVRPELHLPFDEREDLDQTMQEDNILDESEEQVTLTIHHHGKPIPISLPAASTLTDLSNVIADELGVPAANQKFMITPRVGTLKPPFGNDLPLSTLTTKKIVLLGSSTLEISSLSSAISRLSAPRKPSPIKPATPRRTPDPHAHDNARYTFHALRPLAYLPHPERSLAYLTRLAHDPGITAAMRRFRFSVALLTEMDPAAHTTHESRTLGLNRNAGEVIELRLRTDAYDGYRDYRTIRRTLCHELAHNVHGPHDRNFYDLMRQIEDVVRREDTASGGHRLADDEYYDPQEGHVDEGGWTGGEYVLGAGAAVAPDGSVSRDEGLSRREVLARAAEERLRKAKAAADGDSAKVPGQKGVDGSSGGAAGGGGAGSTG